MPFTLTRFIFPLEREIHLSNELGYTLDNPRTDEEVELVEAYLKNSLQLENTALNKENYDLAIRTSLGLRELSDYFKKTGSEPYALQYYDSQKEVSTLSLLAKSWIIVRFNDEGEFDKYLKDGKNTPNNIFERGNSTYIDNFDKLLYYSHILSLLCHDEEDTYRGHSFLLLNSPIELFYPSKRNKTYSVIEHFKDYNFLLQHEAQRATSWNYWLDGKDALIKSANLMNKVLSQKTIDIPVKNTPISQQQSPYEKILFIGELLTVIDRDVFDLKIRLLLLVTVIEYLLTRNPDANRFNVEDSIGKQFKLKTAILIHAEDPNGDLEEIKKSLSKIYKYRSSIAHGGFHGKDDIEDYRNVFICFINTYDLFLFNIQKTESLSIT